MLIFFIPDNKTLLNDYITAEELWACTSCNACVEECPVNISLFYYYGYETLLGNGKVLHQCL
jgi:ferredoxin